MPRQPLVSSLIITTDSLGTNSFTADSLGTDSIDAMEPQVALALRYPAHANTIPALLLFDLLASMEVFHLVAKHSNCGRALLLGYVLLPAINRICLRLIRIAATALRDARSRRLKAVSSKTRSKDAIDDSPAEALFIKKEPAFDVTTRLNRTDTKDEISAKRSSDSPLSDVTVRPTRTDMKDRTDNVAKKPSDEPPANITMDKTNDIAKKPFVELQSVNITRGTTSNIAKKPSDQLTADVTKDKTNEIAKKLIVEPQPANVTRGTTNNIAKKPSVEPQPANVTRETTNNIAKKASEEPQSANVTKEKTDNIAKKPSDEPPADVTTEKTNNIAKQAANKPRSDVPACPDRTDAKDKIGNSAANASSSEQASSVDHPPKRLSKETPSDITARVDRPHTKLKISNSAKEVSKEPPFDVTARPDRMYTENKINDSAKEPSKELPSDVAAHRNRTDTTDKITTSTKEPAKEPPFEINNSVANASLGKQAVFGSKPSEALSKKSPSDLTASPVRKEKINDSTANALLSQQPSPTSHPCKQPSDKPPSDEPPSDITANPDYTDTKGLSTTKQMTGLPQTSVAADCLPSLRTKAVENQDLVETPHKRVVDVARLIQRYKTAISVDRCSNTSVENIRTNALSDVQGHPNKSAKELAALAAQVRVVVQGELRADQTHLEVLDVVQRITLKCQMYAFFGYDTSKRDVDRSMRELALEIKKQRLRAKSTMQDGISLGADSEKQYELREALMGVLLDKSVADGKDNLLTQLLTGYERMWRVVLWWFADRSGASMLSNIQREFPEGPEDYQLRHTVPFHLAMTYLLVSTLLNQTAVGWKIIGARPGIGESYDAKLETYSKLRLERHCGGSKAGDGSSIDRPPNTGGGDSLPVVPGVGIGERDGSKAGPIADGKGDERSCTWVRKYVSQ
ncbi:hypothetical protein LTR87_002095 [Friedmanniomyces endolithicus]|nr:hypothetical protein LTR87_002095 [Friedmanniomyces endolithicus]